MDPIILSILPMVVGLILGFILCVIVNYFRENNTSKRIEELLTKAKKEAEKAKRESILETKEEIHKLKLDYEKELKEKKAELNRCYAREWFAQAPLCIVVCADYSEAWVRSSDGKNHADIDAAIAAEHICLAATSVGLGSCWVCNFDVDLCSQILELPQNVCPVVMIPVVYPSVSDVPDKNRKSIDEIVRIV